MIISHDFRDKSKMQTSTAMIYDVGATVSQFQVGDRKIIFSPQMVRLHDEMLKLRGGIPIMFPNFGSVPEDCQYPLPKHGVVRDFHFGIAGGSTDSIKYYVEGFTSENFPWNYKLRVAISIERFSLNHQMVIENVSKFNDDPMPVGAGIHPYFSTPQIINYTNTDRRVVLDREGVKIQVPHQAKFYPYDKKWGDIKISLDLHRMVTMKLSGAYCGKNAGVIIWTDSWDYFCVEPVINSPKNFATENGTYIEKGQSLEMECILTFKP